MNSATGFGPPSCGGYDTRLDHAKCALTNIASTYGDIVLAFARYRESQNTGDTNCGNGCGVSGVDCYDCSRNGANCTLDQYHGDRFELLTPLVDNNQNDILNWVNLTCGTCTLTSSLDPEIESSGWTPIAGSLRGAKRYLQGLDTPGYDTSVGVIPYWTGPGADPIRNDPLKDTFLPNGDQCRPYIVIVLTDGAETCSPDPTTEPPLAASELLSTAVDTHTYRVETKPIGFGITPGPNTSIERIAHAGGNPGDGSGPALEGYYATDEASLSSALAQIISDSLKFEVCNDLDDDCDGAVDEDFPLKGSSCDNGLPGICHATGTFVCRGDGSGLDCVLSTTPPAPGTYTETCNGLDDDCDNKIDEAPADCTGCQPYELCDGLDNDCDGKFDEGIVRTCGANVGVCTEGTQQCKEWTSAQPSGTWEPCSGNPPNPPEVCNGLDDDCDGTVDGLQEQCTTIPGNDPGVGQCLPGTRTCPTDGSGWGPCLGEVGPDATDPCDGIDNDCDGKTDEDFTPTNCSGTCGTGSTECQSGTIVCVGGGMAQPETCNDKDDDCDGLVDEDVPDMGPCSDGGRCTPGTLVCDASTNGQFECRGGTLPGTEICDCQDNDCDGKTDEEPPALCAAGASCVPGACQCAFPCDPGEFPCPVGRYCDNGFCLVDPCYGVDCQPDGNGDKQECQDGTCVRSCDNLTCPTGQVCFGPSGTCRPDNCLTFPDRCTSDQFCVDGTCEDDPCAGVTCSGADEYCVGGQCVKSCGGVKCPDGQWCQGGSCVTNPCGVLCPQDQFCDQNTGNCQDDPCRFATCPQGQACDPQTGVCGDDRCLGVTCPGANQICKDGSCYDPSDLIPPPVGPPPEYVAPGGGGGCAAGDSSSGASSLLMSLFLLAFVRRRRVK